jgi:hypothetical protein
VNVVEGGAGPLTAVDKLSTPISESPWARVLVIGCGRTVNPGVMVGEVDKESRFDMRPRGGGPCDVALTAEHATYHFLQDIQSVSSTSLQVNSIPIYAAPSLLFGILTTLSRRS